MVQFRRPVNREAYARAQELIATGWWGINVEEGYVFNAFHQRRLGSKTTTYVQLSVWHSDWPRLTRSVRAHRVIWEYVHGAIPGDLVINHLDGRKHNNRIKNLELTTFEDNLRHARREFRDTAGERNGMTKLTVEQASEAIELLAKNELTRSAIGDRFGVKDHVIQAIYDGESWTDLPRPTGGLPARPSRVGGRGRKCLTAEQARDIRARRAAGEQFAPMAEHYGCSIQSISNVINRRTWADID